MHRVLCLAVAAVLLVCAVRAADDEKDVIVLDTKNFDSEIEKHSHMLVEFYAPWCGHCKSLAPEYAKAATALKEKNVGAALAKVDADAHKSLGERFGVKGFPTLKWFVDGKPVEYTGGRTADTIVSWVSKKLGPAATTLADADAFDKFTAENAPAVIGFFASAESDEAKVFLKLAASDEEAAFGVVYDAALASAKSASAPGLVVYRTEKLPHQSRTVKFDGEFNEEAVAKFVSMHHLGLVTEFSQQTSGKIFGSPIKTQILFFNDKAAETTEHLLGEFTAAAAESFGTAVFVSVAHDNNGVMEFFGLTPADCPAIFVVSVPGQEEKSGLKKYAFPHTEITKANILATLADYAAGKLKPHRKSENVPAVQDTPVKVVTANTFDEIVNDKSKDVLVEFYAPWCGHCKKLEPIWTRLGNDLQSVESLVIAKMDATANDPPEEVDIQGFPTILLFNSDAKDKPVTMNGDRSLSGLKKFLKQSASIPFTLPKKIKKDKAAKSEDKDEL